MEICKDGDHDDDEEEDRRRNSEKSPFPVYVLDAMAILTLKSITIMHNISFSI